MTDQLDNTAAQTGEPQLETIQEVDPQQQEVPEKPKVSWTQKGKDWLQGVKARLSGKKEEERDVLSEMAGLSAEKIHEMYGTESRNSGPVQDSSAITAVTTAGVVKDQESIMDYRPLKPGETFNGGMPTIDLAQAQRGIFNGQIKLLYGEFLDEGKWSEVCKCGPESVVKIFKQPNSKFSYYEVEFMRRMDGAGGLPKFEGVVPNGYKMERIIGKKIDDIIRERKKEVIDRIEEMRKDPKRYDLANETTLTGIDADKLSAIKEGMEHEVFLNLLTKDQAQQLLDRVAQYHRKGERVHGDLVTTKGWENIMLSDEGEVRILDTEWENIGESTPQEEIEELYMSLTNIFGIKGLTIPKTISTEDAQKGLEKFKQSVVSMFEYHIENKYKVVGAKNRTVDVKLSEEGDILVTQKQVADGPNEEGKIVNIKPNQANAIRI